MEEFVVTEEGEGTRVQGSGFRVQDRIVVDETSMKIADGKVEFLSEAGCVLIEEFCEALFFANILAENRHFMRLGQFLQLFDRLFHLRLEFLKRPDRQAEFRDLCPPYQAGKGGFGLAEFAQ